MFKFSMQDIRVDLRGHAAPSALLKVRRALARAGAGQCITAGPCDGSAVELISRYAQRIGYRTELVQISGEPTRTDCRIWR